MKALTNLKRHLITAAGAAAILGAISLPANAGVDKVDVIVVYDQRPGAEEDARLNGLGASVKRAYEKLPMRALSVPEHVLDRLANAQGVRFVAKDGGISSQAYLVDSNLAPVSTERANSNLETANVPEFEETKVESLNIAGVAVIDSGVAQHFDLNVAGRYNCLIGSFGGKFAKETSCVDSDNLGTAAADLDGFGHGTHVAGIIGGDGSTYFGKYRGVSGQLPIHSFKVLNEIGQGQVSDVIAALDWILVNGDLAGIRVVNMSLGKGIDESAATDPLVLAVEQVWDAGFVVVASAGNYGLHGNFTITSPGNSRKVITVGSITDAKTGDDLN
ncbi:MAG: S8 family serine peptidase, partial [Gammaproteobacteria bacterium]|nr:S8 family serine peptidase [Gammaproteobacteria bacterium]